jgi:hypothetical protein
MADSLFDGFRFEHSRRDINAPGGMLSVHILAIARNLEEATALAGDILPEQGLRLIGQGPEVLEQARRLGLGDGQAKEL